MPQTGTSAKLDVSQIRTRVEWTALDVPTEGSAIVTATLSALATIVLVNPVPWARAQMAFTLAFHIILVPLGVSWAFMTLIANYRGLRHNDRDALALAQRWSKYMAVTFAVAQHRHRFELRVRTAMATVHGAVGRGARVPFSI